MVKEIHEIAALFNKPLDYTAEIVLKHGIVDLPPIRHPYDGLDGFYSDMTAQFNDQPSLTKQEFADFADPNAVVDRHARGLDITSMASTAAQYGDFTDVPESYHAALTLIVNTKAAFNNLPLQVRNKFDNDPAAFYAFASNPDNATAMAEMGLMDPKIPAFDGVDAAASSVKSGEGEGA